MLLCQSLAERTLDWVWVGVAAENRFPLLEIAPVDAERGRRESLSISDQLLIEAMLAPWRSWKKGLHEVSYRLTPVLIWTW